MNPISSLEPIQESYNPGKELTRVLAIFLSLFLLSLACKIAFRWSAAYLSKADLNPSVKKTASLASQNLSAKKLELAEALRLPEGQLEIYQKTGRDNSEIFLMRKDLKEIPPLIGQYTELEGLWLSNNQLTCLPETIGNLSLLRKLYVDNNKLTALPESLSKLSKLTILQLDNNCLETIPECLFNLPSICKIHIKNNPISRKEHQELVARMKASNYEGPQFILSTDTVEKIA